MQTVGAAYDPNGGRHAFCQASDAGVNGDNVAILGMCDFNAPYARTKDNCAALCRGVSALNESNPQKAACLVVMPDYARESSPRGLWDEERQVMEELFSRPICQGVQEG